MPEHVVISDPPAVDQQAKYNKNLGGTTNKHNTVPVEPGKKFILFGMYAADAVTPDDIPTLKAAVEAITGVQNSKALVWGQAPETIPDDTELILHVSAHLRIEDVPPE